MKITMKNGTTIDYDPLDNGKIQMRGSHHDYIIFDQKDSNKTTTLHDLFYLLYFGIGSCVIGYGIYLLFTT